MRLRVLVVSLAISTSRYRNLSASSGARQTLREALTDTNHPSTARPPNVDARRSQHPVKPTRRSTRTASSIPHGS
jgi:hypothetical protein